MSEQRSNAIRETREKSRSHTRKGPGIMPHRKASGRQRLAPATGAGSIFIDSEINTLIEAGKAEDAAKHYEVHKMRTHKSGAWKLSRFGQWHALFRAGDGRALGRAHG